MTDTATSPASAVNELAIRSSRFRGGEPIVLADGQVWFFPRPMIEYRPKFTEGRSSDVVVATDMGDDFNQAMIVMDDDESDTNRSFVCKMFDVAACMLRFNYDLTNDQISTLLRFIPGDDASQEVWTAITGTARGTYSPKKA